ncbi:MAG: molybdenum ABC transporter ATP-binding protein [Minwuia sp.]|nr:molybdenum ABC transporter ATP-binding protein [Minwuia sp.]
MNLDIDIRHDLGGFRLDTAFAVDEPGITALFGPSGAGKSTIIAAIAGLITPDGGHVRLDGETLFDSAAGTNVPTQKRQIGYVFQDSRLFPHLDVRSNLLFGARRAGSRRPAIGFDALIDLLGIGHLLRRKPLHLSGGERQRVALGRAVLFAPRLLLLDEPFAALDQPRRHEIMGMLEQLRDVANIPMVHVSHALDEVTRLADHMVVLDQGKVAASDDIYAVTSRIDLFPLTGRFEAGSVLPGNVAEHDRDHHLTAVTIAGGHLWVPQIDRPVGAPVRVRVRARDVMLATALPTGLSANNVISGTIAAIRRDEGAYLDVQIACATDRLVARITHRSLARLELAEGQPVHAVIKSVTVERDGAGRSGHTGAHNQTRAAT